MSQLRWIQTTSVPYGDVVRQLCCFDGPDGYYVTPVARVQLMSTGWWEARVGNGEWIKEIPSQSEATALAELIYEMRG